MKRHPGHPLILAIMIQTHNQKCSPPLIIIHHSSFIICNVLAERRLLETYRRFETAIPPFQGFESEAGGSVSNSMTANHTRRRAEVETSGERLDAAGALYRLNFRLINLLRSFSSLTRWNDER